MDLLISTALEMHVAVAILRVQEGLDYSGVIADFNVEDSSDGKKETGIDNPQFINTPEDYTATPPFSTVVLYLLYTYYIVVKTP